MKPPVAYQGGKSRLAGQIADKLLQHPPPYYDLCCGSGAVFLELVNRGVDPSQIRVVDASPWGEVYREFGKGTFDLSVFASRLDLVPKQLELVKDYVVGLTKRPVVPGFLVYDFLVIQACAFGAKAVWESGGTWRVASGFRSYWLPTATSNRHSPVNPMMPMPGTLFTRAEELVASLKGLVGDRRPIEGLLIEPGATVYIDPPYAGAEPYGYTLELGGVVEHLLKRAGVVFVSESRPVSDEAFLLAGAAARAKGGISGSRKTANAEWLSVFHP